jgi:tripartite-type tricarboxylate transporter receptor subunit TctC
MKCFFIILFNFLIVNSVSAWQPTSGKPIQATVGFTPGSFPELSFRIVSEQVEKNTGVNFIITSKPGAGSAVANQSIIQSPSDGHHILLGSMPAIVATDRMVIPNKKYGLDDFTFALSYAAVPMTIIAGSNESVDNIKDFVKLIKSDSISIGDPGSAARLLYEILRSNIGFTESTSKVVRVEYKGPADTLNDVIAGHIRFGIVPLVVSYQSYKANKIKIVAITNSQTMSNLPGVTSISSVYPNIDFALYAGIILPKNTNKSIVDWYVIEFNRALLNKDVQDKLGALNMFVNKNLTTSQGFSDWAYSQEKKFTPLIDQIVNIK